MGGDTRFIVINAKGRPAARDQDGCCGRGQAENHVKSWKTYPAADRTSCIKAIANQVGLFLHAGDCRILWGLRVFMPKRPPPASSN